MSRENKEWLGIIFIASTIVYLITSVIRIDERNTKMCKVYMQATEHLVLNEELYCKVDSKWKKFIK